MHTTTQPIPELSAEQYRLLQLERSLSLKDHDPGDRARSLIQSLKAQMAPGMGTSVLCVGCRNGYELDYLEAAGFGPLVGIDLHSTDPRVRVMDMHALAFDDASFDIVYASHCLEHALHPDVAAEEFMRVVRPGGLIAAEVPVEYGRRGADLWDFLDASGVASLFPGATVLWSHVGPQIGAEKQKAARLILRRSA